MSQLPLALITGMPRSFAKRRTPITRPGWCIEEIFASVQEPDIRSCKDELVRYQSALEYDGVHIFAFHKKESDRGQIARDLGDFHRLVWIDNSSLQVYGCRDFNTFIQEQLAFEEEWRTRLRPASNRDVAILPESSFAAKRGFDALWRRIRSVRVGGDNLDRIATLADQFSIAHVTPTGLYGYMDAKGRVFKYDGARHGKARDALYSWKFTCFIGPDFHYDVQHGYGKEPISIIDALGKTHTFQTHANMDAHGLIVT